MPTNPTTDRDHMDIRTARDERTASSLTQHRRYRKEGIGASDNKVDYLRRRTYHEQPVNRSQAPWVYSKYPSSPLAFLGAFFQYRKQMRSLSDSREAVQRVQTRLRYGLGHVSSPK